MFGYIIPGRSCQTNFKKIGNKKFVSEIDNSKQFTQLMVFKLPKTPQIPNGFGASIYMSDKSKKFMYVGFLTNSKPSTMIDIPTDFENVKTPTVFGDSTESKKQNLFIGVNIEKGDTIKNLESKNTEKKREYKSQISELAKYIGNGLENYIASFSKYIPNLGKEMVIMDLNKLTNWFKKFDKKLANNPNFWKTEKKSV